MASKRVWTVICDGPTARRLTSGDAGPVSARIISNAGCWIYPAEAEEYDVEVYSTETRKWSKTKRTRWVHAGPDRDFMPPGVGSWPARARAAGDALITFLRENPKP